MVLTKMQVDIMALFFTCILSFSYSFPVNGAEGLRGLELQCHIAVLRAGEGVVGLLYGQCSVPSLCFVNLNQAHAC